MFLKNRNIISKIRSKVTDYAALKSRPADYGGQSNITQPKPNVVGTQKNRLIETVLLNTHIRWLSESI